MIFLLAVSRKMRKAGRERGMKKGYLYILCSTVLFSSMEIVLKVVSGQFHPVQITFLRFLIGAVVLMPLAWKGLRERKVRLHFDDFLFFAGTGCICVVIGMMLYQMAIGYSQASVVAVLFSCNPVFVVVFAYFFLHEKIYWYTIASLILSLLGILAIMDPSHMNGGMTGIILTVLSAVMFALYGVTGRSRSERYGGFALTSFSFLFGSMELLLLILISHIHAAAEFLTAHGLKTFADVPVLSGITWQNMPYLIYIAVCITGLGYTFYFMAMEETSAATASLVFFIKPVLAPVMAVVLIHESIHLNMAVGILLIVSGSLFSFIPNIQQSPASHPAGS